MSGPSNGCSFNQTNNIGDNNVCDNNNPTDLLDTAKQLAEKEKDLELAAKIGQSLLEQNHELQSRNEFLEEALNASNDAIIQLRHDLQMRASLLRMYADYDSDLDVSTSGRSNSENLQRKMKRLEDENQSLKNESTNLKKFFSELEEKENSHISEWTKQLDAANEKISRLQQLLAEKSDECTIQNTEMERLLKEVSARSTHEKSLVNENADLHQQLEDALTMHEELTSQVVELQERYTEVMSMLHDAEEELRMYRQNHSAYRTGSADSLYDSLASELEASDNGFYSAINTARIEIPPLRHGSTQQKTDMNRLRNKLEVIKARDAAIPSNATETRSVATATDPLPPNRFRQSSHCSDDVVDVPNHVLAELIRRSRPFEQPHLPSPCLEGSASSISDLEQPKNCTSKIKPADCIPGIELSEAGASTTAKTSTPILRRRASGGIAFEETTPQCTAWFLRDSNRASGRSSCSSSTLSKTTSSESLAGYEGPKMGEPGRPGTRDLDWSIRKLNIRRQIEREYARFRRERGLLPSNASFFNIRSNKKTRHLCGRYHWSSMRPVQSKPPAAGTMQKQVTANDLSRMFKPWKNLANVGLLAAIQDSLTQGILIRSAIPFTPPTTPVRQKLKRFSADSPEQMPQGSSSLLEALCLSISSKAMSFSSSPKRPVRSQSMRNLRGSIATARFFLPEQLKTRILTNAGIL